MVLGVERLMEASEDRRTGHKVIRVCVETKFV